MRSFKTLAVLVLVLFVNTLYAATDYNSSRSNRTTAGAAFDETNTLIKKVSADAAAVSKSMIEVDRRDDFDGEYLITVEVRVSVQRCAKVADGSEVVCSDVPVE